jgi:hypothetical protein
MEEAVGDVGRLAGKQPVKDKRDASQCLRAATFIGQTLTFHFLDMTPPSTSIDSSFLKDRILRLWNPMSLPLGPRLLPSLLG